jgi:hypothetical protein
MSFFECLYPFDEPSELITSRQLLFLSRVNLEEDVTLLNTVHMVP